MDGSIKSLPRKSFLVNCAVGVTVEKTSQFVFQLVDTLNSLGHQSPGEILIGKPLTSLDRVHKVPLY